MHPQEVPSAYLLSGGLDSSILVGLASRQNHKINTLQLHKKVQDWMKHPMQN